VVGENHGDGFLLFDKECIFLSTDLYQRLSASRPELLDEAEP
jgi:hypothetical protein